MIEALHQRARLSEVAPTETQLCLVRHHPCSRQAQCTRLHIGLFGFVGVLLFRFLAGVVRPELESRGILTPAKGTAKETASV